MGLIRNFVEQTRKPEGFWGRIMRKRMDSGHAKLGDWGLSKVPFLSPELVADLGCGEGRNARELLNRYEKAKVLALEDSKVSLEKARELNREMIEKGRVVFEEGDVSQLSLSKESLDLAVAFDAVPFWSEPSPCFERIWKTLKPGGYFLICNERNGKDLRDRRYEKMVEGMKAYTAEELDSFFREAGFSEVQIFRHPSKSWIALLGRK